MGTRSDIKILIDDKEYVGWREISQKTGISESLLRARVNRLGWTLSDAVSTPTSEVGKTGNKISFREHEYSTQEEFVTAVAHLSPFSRTTLKIKLGKLRKQNPDFTEQDLENLVFGKNEIKDEGGFVYLITSLQTGRQYVGITIRTIKERWKAHQSECGDERIQSPLKTEMREYGFDNFTIEKIGESDNSKTLKALETKEIQTFNTDFNGNYTAVIRRPKDQDLILTVKKEGYAFQSTFLASEEEYDEIEEVDLDIRPIEVGGQYEINDITFATNSYDLSERSRLIVDEFADYLLENPTVHVSIEGHTDNVGSSSDNMGLSRNRAEAVYLELIEMGIPPVRLDYKGFGSTKPVSDNSTETGRAQNRRTVFRILNF